MSKDSKTKCSMCLQCVFCNQCGSDREEYCGSFTTKERAKEMLRIVDERRWALMRKKSENEQ